MPFSSTQPAHSGKRLILLDRDGVINEDFVDYIKTPEEWQPLPGSLEAIADLCRAHFDVVVITNQSAIGRGLVTPAELAAIHERMRSAVAEHGGRLAAIYYCPHRPDEGCNCRKPRPGLLERAAADFQKGLTSVPFIGDKLTDTIAAEAVGARPICVRSGLRPQDCEAAEARGVEVYAHLREAVDALLAE